MSSPDPALHAAAYDGLANFRDFGGAPAPGGRVARGRLFRSAHHASLSPADLARLQELGLRVVVDLRRPTERERDPSLRPPGFAARVIQSDDGDRAESPHIAFLQGGDLSDAAVDGFFVDYYRQVLFEPRHLDLFAQAFAALDATGGGPILIHCAAGKDRTGVLAGLILLALGVELDPVIDDYMATNAVMMTGERLGLLRERLRTQLGFAPSDMVVQSFLGVRPAFFHTMLQAMAAQGGGLGGYLASIGVDGVRRERLRAALVVRED